eukprot:TRINITY_DN16980_c0_g2_i1.p1 TRINITY_DN16980_c0_g2~~TRINITY_DN16980_c0_g2_i1.p1  ORF type:complete len:274 (-),score=58.25 TRINITY_DN16980_c0_g2_i1:169-990(-)
MSIFGILTCLVVTAASEAPVVVVTGATGRTGAQVYNQLKEQGVKVRAVVRNLTKAKEVLKCSACDASDGVFVADVTDKNSLTAAMTGATSLAVVTSATPKCTDFKDPKSCHYDEHAYPVDVDFHGGKAQIEAFAASGAKGPVVLCSSMGTTDPENFLDKLGNGHIGFYKLNEEAFLMSSGLPFTIVKPCGLTDGPASQRELRVGHDDDMHETPPLVPRADVARVMVGALLHPEKASGLRFDLCSRPGSPTTDVDSVFAAARYPWQKAHEDVVV